jgi:hypothetical protein
MGIFTLYQIWKKNKFMIMIIGSILLLLVLFIFKHLSQNSQKKLLTTTGKGVKKFKNTVKTLKHDIDMHNTILKDIFGEDSETEDELIKPKKRWMPQVSKGELRCKIYVEKLFGKTFDKIRPDLLKNAVTGHNLEIDLYNDELKLGIEYNGSQHYKFTPGIHKNYEHFQTQRYRDEMKKMICKNAGIVLIEVPYTEKEIEDFLLKELKNQGYSSKFIM